jgi:2-phosphoglycerate kinase
MDLWERAAPLRLLEDQLRASRAGGRIVLVGGEAGAGKSALVAEFARRAGVRAQVLWGGCARW